MSLPDENRSGPHPVVDREMIRKFREQIHALGALWIIIGSVASVIAISVLQGISDSAALVVGEQQVVLFLIAGMGVVWFILGVLTCMKQLWAVYVGLILSYLSLLGELLSFHLCSGIILIVAILQAHRVVRWAGRMRAAGVSLTAKPR